MRPSVVFELRQELERLDKCDKVLTMLLHHHESQAKHGSVPVSSAWHKKLCEAIWDAKGKRW